MYVMVIPVQNPVCQFPVFYTSICRSFKTGVLKIYRTINSPAGNQSCLYKYQVPDALIVNYCKLTTPTQRTSRPTATSNCCGAPSNPPKNPAVFCEGKRSFKVNRGHSLTALWSTRNHRVFLCIGQRSWFNRVQCLTTW